MLPTNDLPTSPPPGDDTDMRGLTRILVIDDCDLVRIGLRTLLLEEPWIARCLSASSAEEASWMLDRYEPHLALVDLQVGGLALCRRLCDARPGLSVVALLGKGAHVIPKQARAAGVTGAVSKHWEATTVAWALRRIVSGRLTFPAPANGSLPGLTVRELDVLRQISHGASNAEAAGVLGLSPHTIKQHASSLYRKLGVRNRAEAVHRAQRVGLLA